MISRSRDIGAALRSRQRGFLLNPYRFGSSVPPDPDFASVELLLHMDGSNGATTFPDSSSRARTISRQGNTVISTAQSMFGGASAFFDDAGDYLASVASSGFNFQTGDLTVECWIRPGGTATDFVIDNRNSGGTGWAFYITSTNTLLLQGTAGSPNFLESAASAITRGAWQHIAWTRASGVNRLFVAGTQVATNSTTTCGDSSAVPLNIGRRQAADDLFFNGYIDELRITKGVARYTGSFTPTGPFSNS